MSARFCGLFSCVIFAVAHTNYAWSIGISQFDVESFRQYSFLFVPDLTLKFQVFLFRDEHLHILYAKREGELPNTLTLSLRFQSKGM